MKTKKDLLNDMEAEYSETHYYLESDRRDVYYSALVKDIVKNNRANQVLKCIFFGVVCAIFAFICVLGLLIIFNVSKKEAITYSDVGVVAAGFGSVLSSIIVLPTIIAKHLFPEDGEKSRFAFVKENQKMDQSYLEDDISDWNEDGIDDADKEEQFSNEQTASESDTQ